MSPPNAINVKAKDFFYLGRFVKFLLTAFFIFVSSIFPKGFAKENSQTALTESISLKDEENLTAWNPRISKNNQPTTKSTCTIIEEKKEKFFFSETISLGASYSYAHVAPNSLPADHGWLYGVQGFYQYQSPNKISFGTYAFWRQGLTNNATGSRFLAIIDVNERIGYCIGSYKKERFANFFTGFGYRLNAEHVKVPGQSVHFDYNNFYIPIGFTFSGRVYPVIYFGTNILWMPQIYPTVNIHPLKGARWSLTYRFANIRIEAPVTFKFYEKSEVSLQLNPYFEYWQNGHTYAKSQLGTKLTVPSNNYIYIGFEINGRYEF